MAMKKIRLESEDEGVRVSNYFELSNKTEPGAFNCNPRDLLVEGAAAPKHCLPEGCADAGGQTLSHL